jgi:hypothetical protein
MSGVPRHSDGSLYGGKFDDEDAFNVDTDRYDKRKVKIICPGCDRVFAALCSPLTEHLQSEWRWQGCEYKQPEADFVTRCGKCGTRFRFTVYTPQ